MTSFNINNNWQDFCRILVARKPRLAEYVITSKENYFEGRPWYKKSHVSLGRTRGEISVRLSAHALRDGSRAADLNKACADLQEIVASIEPGRKVLHNTDATVRVAKAMDTEQAELEEVVSWFLRWWPVFDDYWRTQIVGDHSPEAVTGACYWIFVCNPQKWAIDRFLERRIERDDWGVRPSDKDRFAPGQLAFVRVGVDERSVQQRQGRPRLVPGIYALCEVESTAYPGTGAADEFWAPDEARSPGWPTVRVRYLRVYADRPLTIARLRAERPNLSPLLLKGFQASSFPISERDFHEVLTLLEEDHEYLPIGPVATPNTFRELAELERRYLDAAPEVRERTSQIVERGPIADHVKRKNGFRCQLCEALGRSPVTFLKPDGEFYIEAHHVVPVSKREVGSLSSSNIITVCANHHRQLHYGGVRVQTDEESFCFILPEGTITVRRFRPLQEQT